MAKAKPATKLCKHCRTEIPYDAKICPNCRKRAKGGKLKWIVIVLVLLIVISAMSGGSDSSPKKVGTVADGVSSEAAETETAETGESSAASGEALQSEYNVGDILMDGDTRIVYMSSGVYTPGEYDSDPEEGNQVIYLQFAFENTSDTDDSSISFYSFDCYADGYAVDMYYSGDDDLSATLSAGRTTTGYVYFEVPEDADEILVEYTPNFLIDDEKISFVYSGEQDSGYVPAANTTPTEGAYAVGDVVQLDDITITYLACENYEGDDYDQPKEGYHYVTCTFEFENNGEDDIVPCYWDFDGFADGLACEQNYSREDLLSATVSSGHKAQGTVTFAFPDDASVAEVEYLANIWTSERVVFTAQP